MLLILVFEHDTKSFSSVLRHQLAARKVGAESSSSAAIHLSGFRHASKDASSSSDRDASSFAEDAVTPLERRLYFSTAHFHLRGGCPALAVEVLSKLPNKVSRKSARLSTVIFTARHEEVFL